MKLLTTVLAGVALLAASPMSAQSTKSAESFRLTMPGIRATFDAYGSLAELLASDPALLAKYKAIRKSLPPEKTNGADTMGMTAAKLAPSEPRVAAVFRKAGITPDQSAMTLETLIGVMFGEAMMSAAKGKAETSKLPAFVAENLAFYQANKAEIQGAFQGFAAKGKSIGKSLDDEDDEDADSEKP